MKNILFLGLLAIGISSCSRTDIPPYSITDEPEGGYYIVIEGDTLKPSFTRGWESDTTTGYEFIWDFTSKNNPTIDDYKKITLSIFVYDDEVNPQAMNTMRDSYPVTIYNNTSTNSIYTNKCGIKLTYSTNEIVDSVFTSTTDNGTLYCGFKDPLEVLKLKTTIQGKDIDIHQIY